MHVDDVCKAIYSVIQRGEYNQIINIGSGIPQKFREVIDFVIKETNSSSKVTAIDAVEFHKLVQVKDMYLDVSKLNNLEFKQQINIYEGIKTLL
jgi:nucleoside-diphosphate-sugar epimerase